MRPAALLIAQKGEFLVAGQLRCLFGSPQRRLDGWYLGLRVVSIDERLQQF
jgi:hypothetical protein